MTRESEVAQTDALLRRCCRWSVDLCPIGDHSSNLSRGLFRAQYSGRGRLGANAAATSKSVLMNFSHLETAERANQYRSFWPHMLNHPTNLLAYPFEKFRTPEEK